MKQSTGSANSLANALSFFSSPGWNRRFSSNKISLEAIWDTISETTGPIVSETLFTGCPKSMASRSPTGFKRSPSDTSPLGRPRCEHRTILLPWPIRYWIVGKVARSRWSYRAMPSIPWSMGTLKSTRTSTVLPATSSWSSLRFAINGLRPQPTVRDSPGLFYLLGTPLLL